MLTVIAIMKQNPAADNCRLIVTNFELQFRSPCSDLAKAYFSTNTRDQPNRHPVGHWLFGSISVSGQLPTYLSPNPTVTLTCCQLTAVELGEG